MIEQLPFNPASNEDIDQVSAPLTGSEAVGQSFDAALESTFLRSWWRKSSLEEAADKGKSLTPQDLNDAFPLLPKPFTRPMNMVQAQIIADRQVERAEKQRLISQGPGGLFYGSLNFGASLAVHALDPVELGSGYLIGAGMGVVAAGTRIGAALGIRTATATGAAARLGLETIPSTVGSTALQTAARTAIEGTVGNLAVEPMMISAAASDAEEYTASTLFMSTIGGAVGFAGLRYGVPKVAKLALGGGKKMYSAMFKSAAAQMNDGRRLNLEPIVKDLINETSIGPNPDSGIQIDGKGAYTYEPRPNPSGTEIYVPKTTPTNSGFGHPRSQAEIGDDFGDLIYGTDSHIVANGTASRKAYDVAGNVYRVEVGDVKMLDLNTKLEVGSDAERAVVDWLGQNNIKGIELHPGKTVLEIMDEARDLVRNGKISDAAFANFKKAFSEAGFDGIHHDLSKWAGYEHSRANTYAFFDTQKLKQKGVFQGNKDVVHRYSPEELQKIYDDSQDSKSKMNFDEDIQKSINENIDSPIEHRPEEIKKEVEVREENLMKLEDHPDYKADVEGYKNLKNDIEYENNVIEAAFGCDWKR